MDSEIVNVSTIDYRYFLLSTLKKELAQKLEFPINLKELKSEKSIFKLAVHCTISDQLIASEVDTYPKEHNYSIVFSIEESLKSNTNELYSAFVEINNLQSIITTELEGEIDV